MFSLVHINDNMISVCSRLRLFYCLERTGMEQNDHVTKGHDEGTDCTEQCGSYDAGSWVRSKHQQGRGAVPLESLGGHWSSSPGDPGITGGSGARAHAPDHRRLCNAQLRVRDHGLAGHGLAGGQLLLPQALQVVRRGPLL